MKEYKEDLTGKLFGRLLVVAFAGRRPAVEYTRPYWKCVCSCGVVKDIVETRLKSGSTTSCGCYAGEYTTQRNTTHGKSKTSPHNIWINMKARCDNSKNDAYVNYGGRGIGYDKEWETFEGFWKDMGEGYIKDLTLERIDVNGNYNKDNCTWIRKEKQVRNQRKKKSNKSGVNGVSLQTNGARYIAQWNDLEGSNKSKSFSINKYGEELAFFMACEYREQMINLLNLQGAGYSENHGM